MTKRRPPGMSTQEWVEAQIKRAQNAGEFDDLPGAGKPLTSWPTSTTRTGGSRTSSAARTIETEALLPPAVQLRKEKQQVHEKVRGMRRESEVREYLADLNKRIRISIRDTTGPVVPTGPVDEDVGHRPVADGAARRRARRTAGRRGRSGRPKKSFWQRLFS